MMFQLEMGPEFPRTVNSLTSMGAAVLAACSEGLAEGVKIAAGNVAEHYLSGQSLKRRSGELAREVDGWMVAPLEGVVGIRENSTVEKYKWLLGDEEKTIFPRRARALTIPIGEALTGAGVPRFESAADAERELGVQLFRPRGKNVLGYVRGKRGKFRPLFVLAKSVFVQGSGALADGVLESTDDMTGAIQKKINEKVN